MKAVYPMVTVELWQILYYGSLYTSMKLDKLIFLQEVQGPGLIIQVLKFPSGAGVIMPRIHFLQQNPGKAEAFFVLASS